MTVTCGLLVASFQAKARTLGHSECSEVALAVRFSHSAPQTRVAPSRKRSSCNSAQHLRILWNSLEANYHFHDKDLRSNDSSCKWSSRIQRISNSPECSNAFSPPATPPNPATGGKPGKTPAYCSLSAQAQSKGSHPRSSAQPASASYERNAINL
eukprot:6492136-Amphidinium_carterae.2